MNKLESYYPVICARHCQPLVDFFMQHLQFEAAFSSDWYWHLCLPDNPHVNIAIVDHLHPSVPDGYRAAARGLILNFEMNEVAHFYGNAQANNWDILLPLRDEEWGQRHFIVATPEPGVMLDFIETIPASDAFLKNYRDEQQPA